MFLSCFYLRNSFPMSTAFISAKYLLLIPATVERKVEIDHYILTQLYCLKVDTIQSSHATSSQVKSSHAML